MRWSHQKLSDGSGIQELFSHTQTFHNCLFYCVSIAYQWEDESQCCEDGDDKQQWQRRKMVSKEPEHAADGIAHNRYCQNAQYGGNGNGEYAVEKSFANQHLL